MSETVNNGFEVPVIPSGGILAITGSVERWCTDLNDESPDDVRALFVANSLYRHAHGDWGTLDPEDAAANDWALIEGTRLFSSYVIPEGEGQGAGAYGQDEERLWIITEADRQMTTVLFPSEY